MSRLLSVLVLLLLSGCTSGTSREGSGSPFESGSIEASLEGSSDFSVSGTIRKPTGAITAYLTYNGACGRVVADLRLSYTRDGTRVSTQETLGRDVRFKIGPLGPNKPLVRVYAGERDFTPDSVIFVISDERCV
jgi:hypothetical protein